ncbi:MAG: ankyrin repeat domain-containing protein, partial [Campylobacter sp.]|nr:ankyrin repeat domain-containing protein [Campylobacter sp.]
NIQILKALIECGANVNYGDENSIFFALNSPENIKFLIANGDDMNYKNSFGLTPIFYVVEKKDPELLKFFIYNGAKLNVKLISNTEKMAFISSNYEPYQNLCAFNEPSKTLLMHAAEFGDKNITEMLVKNGANEFEKDDFGLNALDYAILSENNETIQYLKNLGLKENIQKEEFYESETNQTKQASNF